MACVGGGVASSFGSSDAEQLADVLRMTAPRPTTPGQLGRNGTRFRLNSPARDRDNVSTCKDDCPAPPSRFAPKLAHSDAPLGTD